jgi:hypothetical protein
MTSFQVGGFPLDCRITQVGSTGGYRVTLKAGLIAAESSNAWHGLPVLFTFGNACFILATMNPRTA